MNIKGLEFYLTCSACPEQYDVIDKDGNMVGYVRLRWGGLSCEYPDVGGEYIYCASIGDGWTGCFENDEQRMFHLNAIANKILEKIGNKLDLLTVEEKATFKQLFGKYCRQEINKGHCNGSECEWCPINEAYDEIFNLFDDEEDDWDD